MLTASAGLPGLSFISLRVTVPGETVPGFASYHRGGDGFSWNRPDKSWES